jgi:hypothetical protein
MNIIQSPPPTPPDGAERCVRLPDSCRVNPNVRWLAGKRDAHAGSRDQFIVLPEAADSITGEQPKAFNRTF